MRTTRTYLSGCTWCKAEGYVMEPHPQITGDFHKVCPVCKGDKTIPVTETFESELPIPRLTDDEIDELAREECLSLISQKAWVKGFKACMNKILKQ